jgi:hypothetical protein
MGILGSPESYHFISPLTYQPFPQTRWTMVLAAKEGKDQASSDALEHLAQAY